MVKNIYILKLYKTKMTAVILQENVISELYV